MKFPIAAAFAFLSAGIAAAEPTPDLKLVPTDALGFVHVRVAEVWKSEAMKEYRAILDNAGPKALAALDADYTPAPSTLERVTLFFLPVKKPNRTPPTLILLAFNKPFDEAKFKAQFLPGAVDVKSGGKIYWHSQREALAAWRPSPEMLVFADDSVMADYLALVPKADGPLAEALANAPKYPMSAAGSIAGLPDFQKELNEHIPEKFRPFSKCSSLSAFLEAGKEFKLTVKAKFGTPEEAKAGETAFTDLRSLARVMLAKEKEQPSDWLFGKKQPGGRDLDDFKDALRGVGILGLLNTAEKMLDGIAMETASDTVTLKMTIPAILSQYLPALITAGGAAVPGTYVAMGLASRMQAKNNLKQIGIAMHNYYGDRGSFPSNAITDSKAKPLLSWRVAILPHLEEEKLFKQFKLDEPWDSDHNKTLIAKMPKCFADPRIVGAKQGETYYKVFVGKETVFPPGESTKFAEITDGTSQTIMAVAAGNPVPWTKPEDFAFDSEKPLPDLTKPFKDLLVVFCDGHVGTVKIKGKEFDSIMKALITKAGGDIVDESSCR